MNRRTHPRDLIDWIITRILQRITLSATIECRYALVGEMRIWVVRLYTLGFCIGVVLGVAICLSVLR